VLAFKQKSVEPQRKPVENPVTRNNKASWSDSSSIERSNRFEKYSPQVVKSRKNSNITTQQLTDEERFSMRIRLESKESNETCSMVAKTVISSCETRSRVCSAKRNPTTGKSLGNSSQGRKIRNLLTYGN